MKHLILTASIACCLLAAGTASAQDRDTVAGIPVNYDESQVGDYKASLPDALTLQNGKKVKNSKEWYRKRRPEILKLFEENQYGKWPARKPKLRYDVSEDYGLDGSAVRKQVTLYFSKDNEGPRVDVLIYLPKDANGPVPLLLNLSFSPNNLTVADPGVKEGRRWDREGNVSIAKSNPEMAKYGLDATVKEFLKEGYGFATLCYTDIEPDFKDGVKYGVRSLYLKDGQSYPADDEWGSISAWAWGVSNVMDYFEKDPDIDATRIALTGCSRLGKTTMWTGAREPRIAVVIASCSGEGGAALSRRNFGETVAHLTEPTRFPYQFATNYGKYAADVTKSPVDANLLIALIAPRPLLLSTGSTDNWSDPKGEFYAAVEAGPVYELLGKDDLGTNVMPAAEKPIFNTLGYVMHDGGHGVMPQDWKYYLDFIKLYL
jgi:hypothetical protein